MCFNVVMEAFSKPNGSWTGCQQQGQGRVRVTNDLSGATLVGICTLVIDIPKEDGILSL